jgi:hypothetical protein
MDHLIPIFAGALYRMPPRRARIPPSRRREDRLADRGSRSRRYAAALVDEIAAAVEALSVASRSSTPTRNLHFTRKRRRGLEDNADAIWGVEQATGRQSVTSTSS